MRIAITGASGFIGKHLVPVLLKADHSIARLVRNPEPSGDADAGNDVVTQYPCDSIESICHCFSEFRPDVVIHLATLYKNHHSGDDVPRLIASNVTLGTMILDGMAACGVKKMLNFGTRWQHLGNKRYDPANLYAATKEAFTAILEYYGKTGIVYKTLELCDTFGANDTRQKIVDLLVDACKNKKRLLLSPGEQILDIADVDDIVAYIVKNIDDPLFYDNKNASITGISIGLRDLGDLISDIYGSGDVLIWSGKEYRVNEVMIAPAYYPKIGVSTTDLRTSIVRTYGS